MAAHPQSQSGLSKESKVLLLCASFEDPLEKFEIAKLYKDHLSAVAADRRLESFLQAWSVQFGLTSQATGPQICSFGQACDPFTDSDTLLLTMDTWIRYPPGMLIAGMLACKEVFGFGLRMEWIKVSGRCQE